MTANPPRATNLIDLRNRVRENALGHASEPPGFFSLTVPTGGGKTLTSLAFALAHAAAHRRRRIIFVIPYLSIIEQNVDVIRRALGDPGGTTGIVLEHHSNVVDEPHEDETTGADGQGGAALRRRLLAENWDAPVVVTTTVQFFETLFSNRPKNVRRLHNIAQSVVVFDEAQTFPPEMLRPMMGMLKQLAEEPYRTSFVFCTATQPALTVEVGQNTGTPFRLLEPETVRELAAEPAELFRMLKRVRVDWSGALIPATPEGVAERMVAAGSALAIVNTKQQARELFAALRARDSQAFHLSTRMCPVHRRDVLDAIRARLKARKPCLVASSQLVEAGVDLDFPAVWRAMGPLDSIAQAAGRCNREDSLGGLGQVTVFGTWDGKLPPGVYMQATRVTEAMLKSRHGKINIHDPATFRTYFETLDNSVRLDKSSVQSARQGLDFPKVAADFKIIDTETTPVLVPFREGKRFIEQLDADPEGLRTDPAFVQRIGRFTVGLYEGELKKATVDLHQSGVRIFRGTYDDALGLVLPGDYSEA